MTSRKEEIVDLLIKYLVRHGLANLSLRPMADAIGSSARLLIFHFGSKDRLLEEVLEEMQNRMRGSLVKLLETPPHLRRVSLLKAFWKWALDKQNFPYLQTLYSLQMLAIQQPQAYAKYLQHNSLNWIQLIKDALPPTQRNSAAATLYCAVFDGLFLEFLSTGDRTRTTRALDEFLRMARIGHDASTKKVPTNTS